MKQNQSREISAFHDVWVFCEQRQGKLMSTAFELLSEGRKLADELDVRLCALLLGGDVEALADELRPYGPDQILACSHPLLEYYTTDAYAKVVCDLVAERRPEVLLIGATHIGRDLAPRCAARLHTGLCADCTHLDINMEQYARFLRETSSLDMERDQLDYSNRNLKMTRPAFGGHMMATIISPQFRPCMATVRPGVMEKHLLAPEERKPCEVIHPAFSLNEADLRATVVEVQKYARKLVDLNAADVIISVGRGIAQDVDGGLTLAEQLLEALGGGLLGGSRAVVDAGWLEADRQVGQSGKTVRPKLYVALGISGAIQHRIGMQDSDFIIAVNKNAAAPIFEVADCGICGDLYQVVPALTEAIKAAKQEK